ncbi:MAG: ATP-binding protein [Syntrophales bacterium]
MAEKKTPNRAADLRRGAEEIIRKNDAQKPENLSATTNGNYESTLPQDLPIITRTLHELRVHQIELEMQNKALHQAVKDLEASQARYVNLYDLAPAGYVTVSENGLVISANLTAATLLGVTRDNLARQPLYRFILKEDQDIFYRFRKQLFETGKRQVCELRMLKKGSPLFWVNLEAIVEQDPSTGYPWLRPEEDDGPVCSIAISDITARKLWEEYVEMRQEVLAILNDPKDLPDSIQRILAVLKARTGCSAVAIRLQKGKDFPYFAQNGFPADFLKTENTLISHDSNDVVCLDINGDVQLECTCGLVITGRTDPAHIRFTAGGSYWTSDSYPMLDIPSAHDPRHHPRNLCTHQGYASFVLVPLRSKDRIVGLLQLNDRRKDRFTIGMVEHLEGIAAHIGAALVRRWAEEALREAHDHLELRVEERTKQLQESEERLQLAITAADVGIWEYDIVNNRLTWDETMCRFYGITPDKFGGVHRAWEERIHPEDLPKVQKATQQALSGARDFDAEFRVVWPDGSIHFLKANARVERDSEGRPVHVIGTNLDITSDKLLVEAAKAANRAKSLFVGNMSHELRTPLSGVLGMTEALLNTPVTEQQRDYAEKIRNSGKALLTVVSDILDFSKIEAGKMDLEKSPFLVEAVIVSVVNLFGPSAAEEKIGLHATIDPELPAVRGDAHRLTQVVSNLVGNAVKFTKAGEIRVAAKILRRTEAEVDLAISVQDTGIGMTEEEMARLFTPFTQGDTTTARRFGGTGLGLSICRNLLELMRGTIQVESVFGKGSVFTVLVTFPIARGFAGSGLKSLPINPQTAPVTPPRTERPPGDMAELHALLEQLKEPLDNGEPMPCKEIMAALLAKSWPEEQEILLAELNRLVKRYRFAEAFALLNKKAAKR